MSSGGGHTITGGNDFVGRGELAAREGHAGGKEGGSVSQASFGRFIASASRSVPVLAKQRPPRPALRAGDAAKGAMLSFFMAGAPFLTYLPPSGSWSPTSPPAAEVYMRPAEASEMVMSKHWLRRLHTALVALALALVPLGTAVNAADDLHKVAVVSFGLFGDQRVFESEATGAAQIVASRFGADPTIVKFNSKKGGDATTASLAATLQATAKNMDDANDVLFIVLTSHGSPDGLAVVAGRRQETLTPSRLADMLNATHVRYRAVIIAADANHSSFGCEDRAKWTYFGDAFFNVALRQTTRLKDAFALARALVGQREARNGFVPSHPQMAGGENVEPLLIARP